MKYNTKGKRMDKRKKRKKGEKGKHEDQTLCEGRVDTMRGIRRERQPGGEINIERRLRLGRVCIWCSSDIQALRMHLVGNSKQEELTWRRGSIDEGHVLSPDDESVDEGECESEGVGGLLFDEMGVVILVAGHGSASHESSWTVGADTGGSWVNPDGGSVDARLKPTPCEFRDSCRGGDGVLKHELLFASHGPLCNKLLVTLASDHGVVGRWGWTASGSLTNP
jgi:hypothetical protein